MKSISPEGIITDGTPEEMALFHAELRRLMGQVPTTTVVAPIPVSPVAAPTPTPTPVDNRVRVSIIGPRFLFGDTEQFLCDLMAHTDRTKIKWQAVASLEADMAAERPEIAGCGASLLGGPEGILTACSAADVVIVWGGLPRPEKPVIDLSRRNIQEPMVAITTPRRSLPDVRSELKLRPGQRVIACFGEVVNRNNPYALVQALRILNDGCRKDDPDFVGLWVGEGDNIPELHEYIHHVLGESNSKSTWETSSVRILGARIDWRELMQAVAVLLSPKIQPNGGYDILNAWASSTPVVSTPVVNFRDPSALLLVPRAIETDDTVLHANLQLQEIAEQVGVEYAGAIMEVLEDNGGSRWDRCVNGFEKAQQFGPSRFGNLWTETLINATHPLGERVDYWDVRIGPFR